jgi:murein DD-endopeptidase MepM/ murein hydrolase activator NlpD
LAFALAVCVTSVPFGASAARRPEFHIVFPQDATVTEFSSTYGLAKPDGRTHQGEDLFAPKMTPVYAAADGEVIRIGNSPRAGRYIIVDHGEDWDTCYLHLNNDRPGRDDGKAGFELTIAAGIEVGTFVTAGQVIGWVGDSGNAEGAMSHTHFELHYRGKPINPNSYLREAYHRALLEARVASFGTNPPA